MVLPKLNYPLGCDKTRKEWEISEAEKIISSKGGKSAYSLSQALGGSQRKWKEYLKNRYLFVY